MTNMGAESWSGMGGKLACGGAHIPNEGGSFPLPGLCWGALEHFFPRILLG